MNAPAYFEIQADDVTRAANFYGNAFGWKFEEIPGLPIEYFRIITDGMHGGLLKRPAQTPPSGHGTNAYVCSMEVENFDATAAKLMELGAQIALDKFAIPGVCWQGYFIDTEGNTFGMFQVDPNAG